jgi:hypothetical protein
LLQALPLRTAKARELLSQPFGLGFRTLRFMTAACSPDADTHVADFAPTRQSFSTTVDLL